MTEPVLTVDGRRVSASDPLIRATDEGVLQGVGVFDTLRVEAGVALFAEEHLQRLVQGIRTVGMGVPSEPSLSTWSVNVRRWIGEVLSLWREDRGSLRITRTWGSDGTDGCTFLMIRPMVDLPREVSVGIAGFAKHAADPLEGVKGVSRLRNFVARRVARAAGHYDALIPTTDGDLSEGTASNLFAFRAETVWTPALDRGCLPGVTRQKVIRCVQDLGLEIRTTAMCRDDLRDAEEVFLTNSSCGALPVTHVEGMRDDLPGASGRTVRRIRSQYRRLVERYLREARGASDGVVRPQSFDATGESQ